ncbi:uncharacterized protein LOC126894550 [Daktulosphaira vitifoliae]|uniref:uncharacterized protein LOC126894550 n=1 Tax=Daktulosphaira vitifoliae TaxID=58002 RepID=UPI0021A9D492|nr:uncharacterized protein LOC126894550 [Daktulosphaira vitifoliae]
MFTYLYKAILFIDYLDVKLLLKNSIYPKLVVEEIYTVKNYTFLMKTPELVNYIKNTGSIKMDELLEDYIEINNFVDKIVSLTDEIFKNKVTYVNSTTECNLREKYYSEYINNKYEINFVDFVREKLKHYCSETIYKYYSIIGFDELLHPNIARLKPPQNYGFKQNEAIEILNTLFREGDWRLLNHIRIIIGNEIITTNQIIRDNVDDFNFNKKRQYFTQLIKCRYTEVLKNYNTHITAVIQTCRNEKTGGNLKAFVDCTIKFFEIVNDSKDLLKIMLLALNKLEDSNIWEVFYTPYSCLTQTYNILRKFSSEIERLNFRKTDFINLSINELEMKVSKFLFDFQNARINFTRRLMDERNTVHNCCLIEGELLNKNQLIDSWKIIVSLNNNKNTLERPVRLYEYALERFIAFFNAAITSEYDSLGFNKITISN